MTAPHSGFAFSVDTFAQIVDDVLTKAKRLGASDAAAEVSEGCGLSVSVRKGDLENVERNSDKSLSITVLVGQRRGHASTSDFSPQALDRTVRAAWDIARYTADDPYSGLPEASDLATPAEASRDLDLFHPWALDAEHAMNLAQACESAAFATSPLITNSEGAGVSTQQSHFWMGNTRGFQGGYASSRHSLSVSPIAGSGDGMQRDAWYTSARDPIEMASPESVGRYAAQRALSRLQVRRLPTMEVPVLFEAPVASGLISALVQATSGGALYRRASFLADSLGKWVMAKHLSLVEDPFLLKGRASAPFDDEGVRTCARDVVRAGMLKGYFLGSYSARKLGMATTGHAGGAHNLSLLSSRTRPQDDLAAMLKKLHRGLFITELMGHGVNMVTGDYSRGASGFWVENGEIAYPVEEITVAGHLKDMLRGIVAVGSDVYIAGSKSTGSILVDHMKIAGQDGH